MRTAGVLVVLAAGVGGVAVLRSHGSARQSRHDAALRFATGWARGDRAAMWRSLTPRARGAHPEAAFAEAYRSSDRAAGVRTVRVVSLGAEHDGRLALRVAVDTREFRTLRGTVALAVSGVGAGAGVDWDRALRLPGLRRGEAVSASSGPLPRRASILAADGRRLDATALGASIAGRAGAHATGLQRIYDARLGGRAARRLLFGTRVIARTRRVAGRSLTTTIRPHLMARTADALGEKVGGAAVIRPRDGAVLALAGLAVSAPQPPGSTFKIITASAALQYGIATPSKAYPIRTFATLSGVKLRNASGEACGGTLTQAFTESCNSVFAPLGAQLGARRLVATARRFGFGERPTIPAAKPSTIATPSELRDSLAVGAAAIGQDRDLATPLQMASTAATIALAGVRVRPRITTLDPVIRSRAIPAGAAGQVRAMMLHVVRSGTGTATAIPGVDVAGKTGTAELRPNSKDPNDADAWFVAFAPARHPQIAVAVMLVGAGFGGSTAAPVARRILRAALEPSR
ncbi:MAG: penicillin-binding protein [Solirubrobacteraceae bacterium]|nr:penicillin-binding protein [Solirubrobacteraceae bacterium]